MKTVENGPRTIDLDILMYGKQVVEHDRLVIPHKRMLERGFVLKPLCEYVMYLEASSAELILNKVSYRIWYHLYPMQSLPFKKSSTICPQLKMGYLRLHHCLRIPARSAARILLDPRTSWLS